MYILMAFYQQLKGWYDINVLPIVKLFKPHFFVKFITLTLIGSLGYDIFNKYQKRYQFDNKIVFALFIVSVVLVACRVSGDYDYISFQGYISYVDIIIVTLVSYFFAAIINKVRFFLSLYKNEKYRDSNGNSNVFFNDRPIESENEDIFDWERDVKKLSDKIKSAERRKTCSFAITAPWGAGKTSFLNLLEKQINNKDFEIMHFIPRDSKSYKTIQEDFFAALACVLSKYDSKCNHIIKNYMAALQLIDNRKTIEKFVKFYRIWNKDNLKSSIEKSFERLNKKILILIDDFDRLSKEEILEVLKLIDSNAAFKNLIFLTAYDKIQVNKALGESNQSKEAYFIDKFFNLEYPIPSRPYSYISRYLEKQLKDLLELTNEELQSVQHVIINYPNILEDYLPTLRDVKRYLNQINIDYEDIKGDVFVGEFLLIELIKYKYPALYKSTFKKEYTDYGNILFGNNNRLYLKINLDSNLEILSILNILFPDQNTSDIDSYNHIYDKRSFENYFVNRIYSSLRTKDMKSILSQEWNEVEKTLDDWLQDDNKRNDFIDYLTHLDMDSFKDGQSYMKYADILAFLACKLPDSRAFALFTRIIYLPNLKEYGYTIYNLNYESYKIRLLEIIKRDPQLTLIAKLHVQFKTYDLDDSTLLIKDDDIWPSMKEKFLTLVKEEDNDNTWILSRLRQCISKMDEKRKLFLDEDCLKEYRKRIEKSPTFYIKNFVYLGAYYSSHPEYNTIVCEPFWKQIFIDEKQFERFLGKCHSDNIENITLVLNYWALYKANDFKPLEYSNQGPVQKKIDNKLADEKEKLDKIKKIENDIALIPDEINSLSDEQRLGYKNSLLRHKKSLEDINLYIILYGKILKAINSKLQTYSA